jgi:hypothetical protein
MSKTTDAKKTAVKSNTKKTSTVKPKKTKVTTKKPTTAKSKTTKQEKPSSKKTVASKKPTTKAKVTKEQLQDIVDQAKTAKPIDEDIVDKELDKKVEMSRSTAIHDPYMHRETLVPPEEGAFAKVFAARAERKRFEAGEMTEEEVQAYKKKQMKELLDQFREKFDKS